MRISGWIIASIIGAAFIGLGLGTYYYMSIKNMPAMRVRI